MKESFELSDIAIKSTSYTALSDSDGVCYLPLTISINWQRMVLPEIMLRAFTCFYSLLHIDLYAAHCALRLSCCWVGLELFFVCWLVQKIFDKVI